MHTHTGINLQHCVTRSHHPVARPQQGIDRVDRLVARNSWNPSTCLLCSRSDMASRLVVGCLLVVVALLACVQYYDSGRSAPCTRTSRFLLTPLAETTQAQYVPDDLESLLVCITFRMNVTKVHYLEIMLQTALTYHSPVMDILLVTDHVQPLQKVVNSWQLPLNITYVEGVPDKKDKNRYWLTWVHRDAIAKAVAARPYATVLYMEDDTRVTWPTLVSWAIDTRVLAPWNFTRCFYRTEVDPKSGGPRLMDYRHGLDVVHNTTNMILDMATLDPARYAQQVQLVQKRSCGVHTNGQLVQCRVHRHFVAPDNPFQGMWIATQSQLTRFMSMDIWEKKGALAFPTQNYLTPPDHKWGYPERSASIGILGGFVPVPEHRSSAPSSCMLPYIPSEGGRPARLAQLAQVHHMRNAYSNWGNILMEDAIASRAPAPPVPPS